MWSAHACSAAAQAPAGQYPGCFEPRVAPRPRPCPAHPATLRAAPPPGLLAEHSHDEVVQGDPGSIVVGDGSPLLQMQPLQHLRRPAPLPVRCMLPRLLEVVKRDDGALQWYVPRFVSVWCGRLLLSWVHSMHSMLRAGGWCGCATGEGVWGCCPLYVQGGGRGGGQEWRGTPSFAPPPAAAC